MNILAAAANDSKSDGISFILSLVKIKHITDGTSKTYMLGERFIWNRTYETGSDGDDNQSWDTSYDWDVYRWTGSAPVSDTIDNAAPACCNHQFGGPHPGGFVMALCDSSVRLVNFEIKQTIHQQLGSRNSGKSKPSDF